MGAGQDRHFQKKNLESGASWEHFLYNNIFTYYNAFILKKMHNAKLVAKYLKIYISVLVVDKIR
jgi:hypothetical protein